jgi:iron-sulfur cluster repair protein YtfE (RIC family)
MSNIEAIDKDSVIEHVIKQYPQALGLLVGKGVDCCCGAYHTLEQGAAEAGVDLSTLLQELNSLVSQGQATAQNRSR